MKAANLKILIIDDDSVVRMSLGKMLRAKGYDIIETARGDEAIAVLRKEFINLALIDIRLPDISGLEILKTIREISENTIPIMMTAFASLESCIEALNMGAYSYIIKPMNMNQALIIIEKAFEKQQLTLENAGLLKKLQTANAKLEERVSQLQNMEQEKAKLIDDLQKALAEVKTLSGILPICSGCKKIRDDRGDWIQVESYVSGHADVLFSHGMCPECLKKYYPKR